MRYEEFAIQRDKLVRYESVMILIVGMFFIGWIALNFVGLKDAITKWTNSLRYILRDDDLVVESRFEWLGLTWRATEKTIPLRRITDVRVVQGPILNKFDLYVLQVQTASTGAGMPEAVIWALEDPQGTRDLLIQAVHEIEKS
jgi:membrane protein YdbS with pleckstrin-like domain